MKPIIILLYIGITHISYAQKESSPFPKFGKITAQNLQTKTYAIDSSANAVVLSDIGSASVQGNTSGWFSIVSKRHTVIHILNKNGYDEANIEIPLYVDGRNEERVSNLKAVTYNLEDGKIKETKLEKSGQFLENIDKNKKILKFTLPQVKEGSIVEYQYQVTSDFISVLDPWYFQRLTAPTLWSEFSFNVPQFFTYNFLSRGYLPMTFSDKKDRTDNFNVSSNSDGTSTQRANFSSGVTEYRWVIKNAPELKTENYTASVRNHIARMEFQLASQGDPLTFRSYRSTWEEITTNLLLSESFGEKLNANNNWMSEDVKPLLSSSGTNLQKAQKIYDYVRDNFKSNGNQGVYMNQTLRNVFKSKQGSVPEINLLLTAILRYAGLSADPVLISTKSHGYSFEYSAMINSMNYLVVQLTDGGQTYYLDATRPRLGFNRLPIFCYNGHARLVNKFATPLYFSPDSIRETKSMVFFISNTTDGRWAGNARQNSGYYESYSSREEIAEKGKEAYFQNIQKNYTSNVILSDSRIDSLDQYEMPISTYYNMEFDNNGEDILYINPTFAEGYKKNPFVSAERAYPVEMPYAQDEKIMATIEVPKGYEVDEMPKQMLVKMDEKGESFFEYRISKSANIISFMNRLKISKTMFMPDEYENLREFFNLVVKKQSEQIVFKKIK
jgi:hypothetical protein